MSENLTSYTTKVQADVDDRSASAQVVIQRSLQAIYQQVIQKVGRYLLGTSTYTASTVAGTADYTPTDFMQIENVAYSDGTYKDLKEMTMKEYLDNHLNDSNGTPTHYILNGLQVKLWPTPDAIGTLRVDYVPVEAPLGAGDSIIPDRYSNVIVIGADYMFFAYDSDPKAVDYKGLFEEALRAMTQELATRGKIPRPSLMGR